MRTANACPPRAARMEGPGGMRPSTETLRALGASGSSRSPGGARRLWDGTGGEGRPASRLKSRGAGWPRSELRNGTARHHVPRLRPHPHHHHPPPSHPPPPAAAARRRLLRVSTARGDRPLAPPLRREGARRVRGTVPGWGGSAEGRLMLCWGKARRLRGLLRPCAGPGERCPAGSCGV